MVRELVLERVVCKFKIFKSNETHCAIQADRDPRDDEEAVMSDDDGYDPSSIRQEGSEEEGEDLMDNMEA